MRHSSRIKIEGKQHVGGMVFVDNILCGHLTQISPAMASQCYEPGDPGWYAISSSIGPAPDFKFTRTVLGTFKHKADGLREIVKLSPHPELAQSVK